MKSEIQVSFLVPARNASLFLARTIHTIHEFLAPRFGQSFEILIIPNGDEDSEFSNMMQVATRLAAELPNVIVCPAPTSHGKGAALRSGFMVSRGKWIFFTDADLPYDLGFFAEAIKLLEKGDEFVTGNRRTTKSYFTVPVSILPFVYLRHLLGLIFNIIVRRLYNVCSHDTQAGIKAFTRTLAERAFFAQTCPGFLFDIEFFLVAEKQGFRKAELPVHLYLTDEKTTIKFVRETMTCLRWLPKIAYQNLCGHYAKRSSETQLEEPCYIAADDWGLSPAVNQGILTLAQKGVIDRVSILSESPFAGLYLDELQRLNHVRLGLHFNLTLNSLTKSPLKLLILMLNPFVAKAFKQKNIQRELDRQLTRLRALGVTPTHIDGHHHCHIFPHVASEVARVSVEQNIEETRLPSDPWLWISSKFILPLLSLFAKTIFDRHHLKYRPFFYPSISLFKDPEKLKKTLKTKPGYEIIVHPSSAADLISCGSNDSYNEERVIEYDALSEYAR